MDYAKQVEAFEELAQTSPETLLEALGRGLHDAACAQFDEMDQHLAELLGKPEDTSAGVDAACERFSKALHENVALLAVYAMRNLLCVPAGVQLPSPGQQQSKYSEQDEAALDQQLKELREQVIGQRYRHAALTNELDLIRDELKRVAPHLEPLSQLLDADARGVTAELRDASAHLEQLRALASRATTLWNNMPRNPSAGAPTSASIRSSYAARSSTLPSVDPTVSKLLL